MNDTSSNNRLDRVKKWFVFSQGLVIFHETLNTHSPEAVWYIIDRYKQRRTLHPTKKQFKCDVGRRKVTFTTGEWLSISDEPTEIPKDSWCNENAYRIH